MTFMHMLMPVLMPVSVGFRLSSVVGVRLVRMLHGGFLVRFVV
ncbi:hypothetical protein [Burkholderia sp. WSM2230]|nr:hypothetical protein [Burkholderia sp. WSM2230]